MATTNKANIGKPQLTIDEVIGEEREAIRRARLALQVGGGLESGADQSGSETKHEPYPVGLALSGGGVRSASFSLGVLQAIAKSRLLPRFDYLSTVSGGGFIGGWLTAWLHREALKVLAKDPDSQASEPSAQTPSHREKPSAKHTTEALKRVQEALSRALLPTSPKGLDCTASVPRNREAEPVAWLRRYSRYLAPTAGSLSLDSVTLATTWMRNVFLNALIMFALLALLLLSVRLLAWLLPAALTDPGLGVLTAFVGALFLAAFAVQLHLQNAEPAQHLIERVWIARAFKNHRWTLGLGFAYVFLGGIWAASVAGGPEGSESRLFFGVLTSVAVALVAALFIVLRMFLAFTPTGTRQEFLEFFKAQQWGRLLPELGVFFLAGVVAIATAYGGFSLIRRLLGGDPNVAWTMIRQLTFAPALALVTFGVSGSLFVGVVGRVYGEGSREWWARLNASFLRLGAIVLLIAGLTFGAGLVDWVLERSSGWVGAIVASGWVGTALASLFGSRVKLRNEQRQRDLLGLLNVCAIVFAAGLMLLASLAVHEGLNLSVSKTTQPSASGTNLLSKCEFTVRTNARRNEDVPLQPEVTALSQFTNELRTCIDGRVSETANILSSRDGVTLVAMAWLAAFLTFVIVGARVDVNRFSLHDLYKLRLIRCYLGASRGEKDGVDKRKQNAFTGFDASDDFELSRVSEFQRPLHLLNAAVNLTIDTDLAWQDRKAASFTFSSLHCGFVRPNGGEAAGTGEPKATKLEPSFVRTSYYGAPSPSPDTSHGAIFGSEREGFFLGSAIATSGAAVSPTSGTNTKPALAFLLTIFNLRTGRWCPNPLRPAGRGISPLFGPYWLLRELFGLTSPSQSFVHLSDGGHFDNLGLYELVRRQCELIVCVDASADEHRQFGDLGNAVRRCRVDFNADIDLDTRQLDVDRKTGYSKATLLRGAIHYRDSGRTGTLIYVKPSLLTSCKTDGSRSTALPRDILSHHIGEPSFPHVSTADQFFSEAQFESYRRLGQCAGELLCKELR